jgi:hypothetical protein
LLYGRLRLLKKEIEVSDLNLVFELGPFVSILACAKLSDDIAQISSRLIADPALEDAFINIYRKLLLVMITEWTVKKILTT